MTGVTRPRQNTFTLMCQVLCEDHTDTQRLVSAYAGAQLSLPEAEDNPLPRDAEREVLRLRSEQFLEQKTQSIQFRRSIERELDEKKIPYKKPPPDDLPETGLIPSPYKAVDPEKLTN